MKFIIRNIGWILLIIFFIFMLYLISNQNNDVNQKNMTGNIITKSISGESTIIESENEEVKNKEEKKEGGFIKSIRNFFTLETKVNNEIKNTDKSVIKQINGENEVNEKLIEIVEQNIKGNKKEINNNLDSNSKNVKIVGVKSIFLNNAYFTKRLYTAYKGDKLEQLTNTNRYGCFKVKVISSKDIRNNGKIAWTCDYYMKDKKSTIQMYKKAASEYNNKIKRNITKTYRVNTKALKLNNSTFNKKLGIVYYGDKVKQLTPTNRFGCFQIEVLNSKNKINNGKIAWACKKYLK